MRLSAAAMVLICLASVPTWAQDSGSVNLGVTNAGSLVSQVEYSYDGNTVADTIGGVDCRRNENASSDFFMYFQIDDSLIYQGNHMAVEVDVVVFDSFSGGLRLHYDAADGTTYKHSADQALVGDQTWKVVSFRLTDAYFGNRQHNNADIRIRATSQVLYYVDVVRVRKALPVRTPYATATIDLGEDSGTGISLVETPPGSTSQVSQGDVLCRRNSNPSDQYAFSFDVADGIASQFSDREVGIVVEVLDAAAGSVDLQYGDGRAVATCGTTTLTGSGEWTQVACAVTNPDFVGGIGGSVDFRLGASPGISLTVNKVVVQARRSQAHQSGATHVGGKYQYYSTLDHLNDSAAVVTSSGLRQMKIWLTPDPWGMYPFNTDFGDDPFWDLSEAAAHPHFHDLFRRPIDVFLLTTFRYGTEYQDVQNGFLGTQPDELEADTQKLAEHLLRRYNGTKKTFIIGMWEGDSWIRGNHDWDNPSYDLTQTQIMGYVSWMKARQRGVEAARAAIPWSDVTVLHGVEVNAVRRLCWQGRPCVAKDVLPLTAIPTSHDGIVYPAASPDVVTYSSWEVTSMSHYVKSPTGLDPTAPDQDPVGDSQIVTRQMIEYIKLYMPDADVAFRSGQPVMGDRNVIISEYGGTEQEWLAIPGITPEWRMEGSSFVAHDGIEFGGGFGAYLWQTFDTRCCPDGYPCCPFDSSRYDQMCLGSAIYCYPTNDDFGDPGADGCYTGNEMHANLLPVGASPPADDVLCSGYWLRTAEGHSSLARDYMLNALDPFLSPPWQLTCSRNADGVSLEFEDDQVSETHYRLERSVHSTSPVFSWVADVPVPARPTQWLDTPPDDDTKYIYRLRSEDGTSLPSSWYYCWVDAVPLFSDGFESGDFGVWSDFCVTDCP
jgi:hypothetical protein